MQRYKIVHRTHYGFTEPVELGPHSLLLRPREGHELRIESSKLHIEPTPASLSWFRDAEDNSVAIATFQGATERLTIESEIVIQQYNETPLDFMVADYAVNYPFVYKPDDRAVLSPYMNSAEHTGSDQLDDWLAKIWQPGEPIQTYALLRRINEHIPRTLAYQMREEPGVQGAVETLALGTGSCRDFANLFMEAARLLGLPARFVSGYLHVEPAGLQDGSTHAWAEVYLPGAGWKGFDPTHGEVVGTNYIAVAVARQPESVPPVAGSFVGPLGAGRLEVSVCVNRELLAGEEEQEVEVKKAGTPQPADREKAKK
ncbi:Transglutaminase-like Super Family Protein [Azotobacter vinelandii CA]|uniref:Transglutaminase-like Super Family Protein n=2 Tax=Azotobacter vinelandii TaxID=354 RepID=C1DG22_AZOVD|nr:transglutaminase family protein [Azotobacter vinelandii]ACO76349.1 Transglutaminase-like Super Family Protein [Azotobacter vinelandii DJ]AGK17436.1 Transglutaminase-like Super Family Protein [Azotobacter vinelandii CA]AGK19061.1 Transglutaminase-like Super Family Protein [Azotobacter vinelandii CA6]WKN22132.1 transglutaminase family protein [Azotobacter vinelandii]SFY24049.1 Transglutaminase-like enzyme, putative cysteine protease [Azotobacter vinelandii]